MCNHNKKLRGINVSIKKKKCTLHTVNAVYKTHLGPAQNESYNGINFINKGGGGEKEI